MKHITRFLCIGLLTLGFAACDKDDDKNENPNPENPNPENPDNPTPEDPTVTKYNAIVLNEGGWGNNNASMSALNTNDGSIENDWFSTANGRGLGDVAQDMVKYGSKLYATVTYSNSLEVIDPKTGKSQRVDLGDRNPRHIAAEGGKLYITCYKPCSVVRVDTASLEVEATCTLGQFHPEGIAIAQGKAFVASCVTDDYSDYDDKVYVIDLTTFAAPTTITVGLNPSMVKKIDEGKVLVAYAGNYSDIPGGSAIISTGTLDVTQTGQELSGAAVYNGKVYGYASVWVENNGTWSQTIDYFTLDPNTLSSTPIPFLSNLANPYGIDINPANGDIYVYNNTYVSNGDVHCFTANGTPRFTVEAGMLPKKTLFL